MVRVIEDKIISNDLRGNENWFELAGVRVIEGSSYRESTVALFRDRAYIQNCKSMKRTSLSIRFVSHN